MRIVLFYHSLVSDWNHGNAHFLRGVTRELLRRGHDVAVYEQRENWSRWHLKRDQGPRADAAYREAYPELQSITYEQPEDVNPARVLRDADLAIIHEWGASKDLIARLGAYRRSCGENARLRLLFHDTHHRCISRPGELGEYDLRCYDGVLAYGNIIRDTYLREDWAKRAWTWHEAADTTVFYPRSWGQPTYDVVWVGNWGDDERTAELREFLLEPVRKLGLRAKVYGVRYPDAAVRELTEAGIDYGGYLPNHRVPGAFADARITVHIPRRPYVQALPGIPTIRPFEALACGIPLICSPWRDCENLFTPGEDLLMVQDGEEMTGALARLLEDRDLAHRLARRGRETILARHTCPHRVDQLLGIVKNELAVPVKMGGARRTRARCEGPIPPPGLREGQGKGARHWAVNRKAEHSNTCDRP